MALYRPLLLVTLFSFPFYIFQTLQASFEEVEGLLQYSYIINLFGYLALTIGFGNEVYNVFPKKKGAKKGKKK
jgi:hypothetical protein